MADYICPICGNSDIHSIGYLNSKPYCRRCIAFKGESVCYTKPDSKDAYFSLAYELSEDQKELSSRLIRNYKNGINSLVYAVCGSPNTRNT